MTGIPRYLFFVGVVVLLMCAGAGGWAAVRVASEVVLHQPIATPTPVIVPQASSPAAVASPTPTLASASGALTDGVLVKRVVDGDTIELQTGQKVRYIGVDTPETVASGQAIGCYGPQASAQNKLLVEGKTVRLQKDVSETDRYGRLLRYVYVGDVFVNDYLVRQGFAKAINYPPDTALKAQLAAAQSEAQANHRGLWASCPAIQ